jgi:hypothetical protein
MFETSKITCRLSGFNKRNGAMGERNGKGTVELIDGVLYFAHLDPVMFP